MKWEDIKVGSTWRHDDIPQIMVKVIEKKISEIELKMIKYEFIDHLIKNTTGQSMIIHDRIFLKLFKPVYIIEGFEV